jgi:diadenosine tetraphosphate (Ap4A) HIT family hydrolase
MNLKNNSEEKSECIFCYDNVKDRIIAETDMFYAVKDGFPVTEGHLLVIPKRHVAEYFDLSDIERRNADNFMKNLYRNMVKK